MKKVKYQNEKLISFNESKYSAGKLRYKAKLITDYASLVMCPMKINQIKLMVN